MPQFDLSGHELASYDPPLEAPADLDSFWEQTLAETRAHDLDPQVAAADSPFTVLESFDVSWRGFGGDPIRGWLHLPASARARRRPAARGHPVPGLRRRARPGVRERLLGVGGLRPPRHGHARAGERLVDGGHA